VFGGLLGRNAPVLIVLALGLACLWPCGPVFASEGPQVWFETKKIPNLVGCVLLSLLLAWQIFGARKGKLFIRRIAGLEAVEEALGRAAEMGRPVLYVPGLEDINDSQTLASLSILGHTAFLSARYDTTIICPCYKSVVMAAAQEAVQEAYLRADRPEAYDSNSIHYVSDDSFAYAAAIDGIMLRERPAANFYIGRFYAESLILAETGYATGAMQIAATASTSQLPFFVAACDYTLIGEELYAASAYLTKDPMEVGSLRGQDMGKAVIFAVIALGCVEVTLGLSQALHSWTGIDLTGWKDVVFGK
jgi:hypothetical protein